MLNFIVHMYTVCHKELYWTRMTKLKPAKIFDSGEILEPLIQKFKPLKTYTIRVLILVTRVIAQALLKIEGINWAAIISVWVLLNLAEMLPV